MTSICSLNISIAVHVTEAAAAASIIEVTNNLVVGIFGKQLDKYIVGKYKRICQFKEVNGTSSAMTLLNENQIHFYSIPQNLLGDNLLGIEYSSPVDSENVYLAQILDKPEARNSDSLGFIEHSKLILQFIIIGFLLKLLSIFIFLLFRKRKNR